MCALSARTSLLHPNRQKVNSKMSAPAQAPNGAGDAKDPSGFLSEIIGAPVTVKLNSGVVYKGLLEENGT
jgi:hypothetical protein